MFKQKFYREQTIKAKATILFIVLFITTIAFADYRITRGPDIGEIYFIGPTVTGEGIYHSTDFGETAVCVDSISEVISICADLTIGSLYRTRMPDVLYYSNNYGNYGSWVFRSNDISLMLSGRNEGYIYNKCSEHSENYGIDFITHSCHGYFGILKTSEIDNQDSVGYSITEAYGIPDSLFLLISYDNFENFEQQYVFNFYWSNKLSLSRGFEQGGMYLYKTTIYGEDKELFYTNDYGETWELKNTFNCPNIPIKSIVGGRQPGELYMVVEYIQLMYEIAHIYIYHSIDYGETFTVYHPFSHGPEPYVANFEATPAEGTAPLTVQFTDLSTGENLNYWEWDFDNDGTIDSYEQNPEYTYQDTGYYSVSLTIHPLQLDTATRFNYIHVTDTVSIDEDQTHDPVIELSNYPNPFNPITTISYRLASNTKNAIIEIYNLKGQLVKVLETTIEGNSASANWDGTDLKGHSVSNGIYFYTVQTEYGQKTNKMLKTQ